MAADTVRSSGTAGDDRHRDAVVVGGNIAGLSIAYFLAQVGYRTTLLEKSPAIGGTDRSFKIEGGASFDCGLHVLDYMRSELVTHMFQKVVDGKVRMIKRKRGIVLGGHQVPYNVPPEGWPDELRALLKDGPIVDDIGSERPTREQISRVYGPKFAEFIYESVLPSYPTATYHQQFGVHESELLVNIYPWFFPHVARETVRENRSRRYHDVARSRQDEWFLYPTAGHFGAFAEGIHDKLLEMGVEVVQDIPDLDFAIDADRDFVEHVTAQGKTYTADRVFWCGPVHVLGQMVGRPIDNPRPDVFVLGSFEYERPPECAFQELIVGDPNLVIDRGSFPGKISGSGEYTVQLEFAFPRNGNTLPLEAEHWKNRWHEDLVSLGIVEASNRVKNFDFKAIPMLYNCYGIDGKPMPDIDFSDLHAESNLRPALPSIRAININTRVPQFFRYIAEELTKDICS